MRDILFRGKRIDNNEWVTGTPFIEANCCKMITAVALHPDFVDEGNVYFSEGFPVRQETVGQYTGLTDKNGKKIFEGDIIIFNRGRNLPNTKPRPLPVFWDERNVQFTLYESPFAVLQKDMMHECEVIGNIHDNPELLENNTGKENSI